MDERTPFRAATSLGGRHRSSVAVPVVAAFAGWWLWRHGTSPAVKAWKPPGGTRIRAEDLSVRVAGDGEPVFVLLHGLTASGDTFGAAFDVLAERGTLVVPDLLGFGRSLDLQRKDFPLAAHMAALDAVLVDLGLSGAPLVVVGHSMGAVLALHWAARTASVQRVVAFSAPMYESEDEARRHIARMGLLEKFFALDSPLAHWTCQAMCTLRSAAQWVAVAISPEWPVPIARQGVLHSWPAYLGGMNGIIMHRGWRQALETLSVRGVPVVLADGADDPVPVAGLTDRLAEQLPSVEACTHPSAGHDLPVGYSPWGVELIVRGDVTHAQMAPASD